MYRKKHASQTARADSQDSLVSGIPDARDVGATMSTNTLKRTIREITV